MALKGDRDLNWQTQKFFYQIFQNVQTSNKFGSGLVLLCQHYLHHVQCYLVQGLQLLTVLCLHEAKILLSFMCNSVTYLLYSRLLSPCCHMLWHLQLVQWCMLQLMISYQRPRQGLTRVVLYILCDTEKFLISTSTSSFCLEYISHSVKIGKFVVSSIL